MADIVASSPAVLACSVGNTERGMIVSVNRPPPGYFISE